MLLFIAIVATLNLCAGYVIGAHIGWLPAWLEGGGFSLSFKLPFKLPFPRRKVDDKEADDDKNADDEPEVAAEEPADDSIAESQAEADTPDAGVDSSATKVSHVEVMEGLSAFQDQLAGLTKELAETDEDAAFDECCERVQQANHEYLDHANDAVKTLASDEEAAPIRDAVKAGAEEVKRVSDEFDSTMASSDKGGGIRDLLRELSGTLLETAEAAGEELRKADAGDAEPEAASPLPPLVIDPETKLATLDSLMGRLETMLEEATSGPPLVIATVKADTPEEEAGEAPSPDALLARLGDLVDEALGDIGPPAVYKDDQLLMLLPGDSVDDASQRIEQIRQQVEATKFVVDGEEHSVTVSCGMAQTADDIDTSELQELLADALAEAHRYGGNRACHHDGKFPAPVMPGEVQVEERTVKL